MNFTNIANAIKSIEGVKNKPEYVNLRIAHGKDRCANPPRSGPQGGSGVRRATTGNSNIGRGGAANGVAAVRSGSVGVGEDGEMQFIVNGEVGEEDEGVLDVIAELRDTQGDVSMSVGGGVGEGQDMHVDGEEPAAAGPIITSAVV